MRHDQQVIPGGYPTAGPSHVPQQSLLFGREDLPESLTSTHGCTSSHLLEVKGSTLPPCEHRDARRQSQDADGIESTDPNSSGDGPDKVPASTEVEIVGIGIADEVDPTSDVE